MNLSNKILLFLLDNGPTKKRDIAKGLGKRTEDLGDTVWRLKKQGKLASPWYGTYEITTTGTEQAMKYAEKAGYQEYGKPAPEETGWKKVNETAADLGEADQEPAAPEPAKESRAEDGVAGYSVPRWTGWEPREEFSWEREYVKLVNRQADMLMALISKSTHE